MTPRTSFQLAVIAAGVLTGFPSDLRAASAAGTTVRSEGDPGAALNTLSQPSLNPGSETTGKMSRADHAAQYSMRAAQARSYQSTGSTDFYTTEAKRVEALNLSWAALNGDLSQSARLDQLVEALRRNPVVSIRQRFELVAWSRQAAIQKEKPRTIRARLQAQEGVARELIAEFSGLADGYEALLGIARDTDAGHAREILLSLQDLNPPTDVRTEAAAALTRLALTGKALRSLVDTNKSASDWASESDRVRVVFSWSSASADRQAPQLRNLAAKYPQIRWLGVCLDRDVTTARAKATTSGLPGAHYYSSTSPDPVAGGLALNAPGLSFLVDRAGIIREVNALVNLSHKLRGIGL